MFKEDAFTDFDESPVVIGYDQICTSAECILLLESDWVASIVRFRRLREEEEICYILVNQSWLTAASERKGSWSDRREAICEFCTVSSPAIVTYDTSWFWM